MPEMSAVSETQIEIGPEDQLRAQVYRLLSYFLSAAPDQSDLTVGADLDGDDTALGKAIAGFAHLCAKSDPASVADEYQNLFIGMGRGELLPYGSYYLTGFLHEKPLAKLRDEMERLGLEREEGTSEPEDHIASVLEMMAGFIEGTYGDPMPLDEQKAFFDNHVGSWAGHFFRDLEAAKTSVLYATLGSVGRAFLEIEDEAFRMV